MNTVYSGCHISGNAGTCNYYRFFVFFFCWIDCYILLCCSTKKSNKLFKATNTVNDHNVCTYRTYLKLQIKIIQVTFTVTYVMKIKHNGIV